MATHAHIHAQLQSCYCCLLCMAMCVYVHVQVKDSLRVSLLTMLPSSSGLELTTSVCLAGQ